jgi:hypothetical protein
MIKRDRRADPRIGRAAELNPTKVEHSVVRALLAGVSTMLKVAALRSLMRLI